MICTSWIILFALIARVCIIFASLVSHVLRLLFVGFAFIIVHFYSRAHTAVLIVLNFTFSSRMRETMFPSVALFAQYLYYLHLAILFVLILLLVLFTSYLNCFICSICSV